MIDWHSHILPNMDDGSKSLDESLKLLELLSSQDVDTVVATPHFYAENERLDSFLARRTESLDRLRSGLGSESRIPAPSVISGAEVRYYKGISRLEGLEKLKVERSRLLLLEMPFERWSDYVLKEVEEISRSGIVSVLLAHIDRYYGFVDLSVFDRLRQNGVDLQINAEAFDSFFDRAKAYKMIRSGLARFLGSDCHNLDTRAPKIGIAFDYIRKKAGKEFLYGMNKFGHSLFVIKQ